MQNKILRKGLALAVLVLFMGVTITPITIGIEKNFFIKNENSNDDVFRFCIMRGEGEGGYANCRFFPIN